MSNKVLIGPCGCCGDLKIDSCVNASCVSLEYDLEWLVDNKYGPTGPGEYWISDKGSKTFSCAGGGSKDLITLDISSSFGGGAKAQVVGPTGWSPSDSGPISGVYLTSQGAGYAKLGRVGPSLSVSGGSGTGLTITPTLSSKNNIYGMPTWSVSSVSFSGGKNYIDGESLTVSASWGDTTITKAQIKVQVDSQPPTLSANVSGGSGSTFSASLSYVSSQSWPGSGWQVTSVQASGPSTGYADNSPVAFSLGPGVGELQPAQARIRTTRAQPSVTASVSGGSGASLSVNLSPSPAPPADDAMWHVSSVTVNKAGEGYTNGDPVTFTVTDGTQVTAASATIVVADRQEPTLNDIFAIRPAARENPNLTPYVYGYDGTTAGSGAVLSATMVSNGDDPETWRIASINVIDGGSGYAVGEYFWYSEFGGGFDNIPPYYLVEIDGWLITSVDENGAITGIGLDGYWGPGKFYKQGDPSLYYGGAAITANMTQVYEGGLLWWTPSTINIINGGSGYEVGDFLRWAEPWPTLDGSTPNPAYDPTIVADPGSWWIVTGVDGNGAITSAEQDTPGLYYQQAANSGIQSVTITNGGDYYKSDGSISKVVVTNGGRYRSPVTGLTVTNPGEYYREDASAAPYVAKTKVNISQYPPSNGSGATMTASIETSTASPNFGSIKEITIDDPGDGYLARRVAPPWDADPPPLLDVCEDVPIGYGYNSFYMASWGPVTHPRPLLYFSFLYGYGYDCCGFSFHTFEAAGEYSMFQWDWWDWRDLTGGYMYDEGSCKYDHSGGFSSDCTIKIRSFNFGEPGPQPTVTATPSAANGGSGGQLSVSLAFRPERYYDYWSGDSPPGWAVESISVTNPGSGYLEGDEVVFDLGGSNGNPTPQAIVHVDKMAPISLVATVAGGSGGSFSTTIGQSVSSWYVEDVSVKNGGSGYADATPVIFAIGPADKQESAATATAYASRVPPTLQVVPSAGGSGAVFSISLYSDTFDWPSRVGWFIDTITATSPGSGYAVGQSLSISVTDGVKWYGSDYNFKIGSVDGNGGITSIIHNYGDAVYYKSTGSIEFIIIDYGGSYYRSLGSIQSVELTQAGRFGNWTPKVVIRGTVKTNMSYVSWAQDCECGS